MTKFERGMQMLRAGWAVVKQRPGLAVIAGAGWLVSIAIVGGLAAAFMPEVGWQGLQGKLVFVLLVQVGMVPATFTNFVIAAIADRHFRGEELSVGGGFALAARRAPQLLAWSAVSMIVGFILQAVLERFKLGGAIASRLVGLAWGLATMFVVPVLAIEEDSVGDAISRSAKAFKQQWGPSVASDVGLGLVFLGGLLGVGLLFGLLALVNVIVAGVLAALTFVAAMALFGATSAVKNVALYRFAAEGVVVGDYTVEQLNGAFRPKKKRFGR